MGGLDETSNGTTSFTITSIDFVNDLPDEVHATTATTRETTRHNRFEAWYFRHTPNRITRMSVMNCSSVYRTRRRPYRTRYVRPGN